MQGYDSCLASPVTALNLNWVEERDELSRLLADPEFHCTERNKRFLTFISEELFAGRHATIKGYTIAVDVFGRSPSFDPLIDPIVRIEATRLRTALTRYYEHHGQKHNIHIDLPRGRYVPEFLRRGGSAFNHDGPASQNSRAPNYSDKVSTLTRSHPGTVRKRIAWIVGIVGGLLLGAALMIAFWRGGAEIGTFSDRPTVAIRAVVTDTADDSRAFALRDALTVALTRFQTLRISSAGLTLESKDNALTGPTAPQTSEFLVTLRYGYWNGKSSVWWRLVDQTRHEVLASNLEVSTGDYTAWAGFSGPLIPKLANEIAGRRGIIGRRQAAADSLNPTLGNGCIARARAAVDASDNTALEAARKCLLATLNQRPTDADAHASLATVLIGLLMRNTSGKVAVEALEHADRAVALEPDSPNNYYAQMLARYYDGQPDAAILSGRRANELNPFDAAINADLGSILFLTGHWDEGLSLISYANGISDRVFAGEIMAFDAYRRGFYAEALRRLQGLDIAAPLANALKHGLEASSLRLK